MPESRELLEAERFCAEREARLTPVRRLVLDRLLRAAQPMSAYELIAALRDDTGRHLNPPTMYRALEFLVKVGLLSRIESRNAFVPCQHPGEKHDCLFFVCNGCGTTIEIDDQRITQALSEDAAKFGFQPSRRVVEVQGLCRGCAGIE
jgi:Fur family zinc uptake transcriptional regulator